MNKENNATKTVKGFKVFNPDWTCRNFQYEVGKTFKYDEDIELCGKGLHFCKEIVDCFRYYQFDPENKVAEVAARGLVLDDNNKSVTNELHIIREISWEEVLRLVNSGKGNSGYKNSGDRNSGDRNSGDRNSGDSNSGDSNSGDWNSGYSNSGDSNSGHSNSGYRNSGDRNSGDRNSGDSNSGDSNSGDWNSGYSNSGDSNSGHSNSGYRNSGYRNSGDRNSGDWNSGYRNSGDSNSGDSNSGHSNSGDSNSGDWNSGDWNSSDGNAGCFNTEEHTITMFDKPSNITLKQWRQHHGRNVLNKFRHSPVQWIPEHRMTDEEKEKHPTYKTTGGYLKENPQTKKEAFQEYWNNLNTTDKAAVLDIPNFDPKKFQQITGVDVNK